MHTRFTKFSSERLKIAQTFACRHSSLDVWQWLKHNQSQGFILRLHLDVWKLDFSAASCQNISRFTDSIIPGQSTFADLWSAQSIMVLASQKKAPKLRRPIKRVRFYTSSLEVLGYHCHQFFTIVKPIFIDIFSESLRCKSSIVPNGCLWTTSWDAKGWQRSTNRQFRWSHRWTGCPLNKAIVVFLF